MDGVFISPDEIGSIWISDAVPEHIGLHCGGWNENRTVQSH